MTIGRPTVWTPELDDQLRAWARDQESSGDVVRRLFAMGIFVTRNAVIGRAHRIGLHFHSNSRSNPNRAHQPRIKPPGPVKRSKHQVDSHGGLVSKRSVHDGAYVSANLPAVVAPLERWGSLREADNGVAFINLEFTSCRWPAKLDDRGVIELYCGATNDGPYCPAHSLCASTPYRTRPFVGRWVR